MTDLLFSHETLTTGDGSLVHVAFTSQGAGNLGLHVGDEGALTLAARARLQEELLGEGSCGFTYLNQVHGVAVYDADAEAPGQLPQEALEGSLSPKAGKELGRSLLAQAPVADAASSSGGRPLAVMVADCIPLVFVGEKETDGSPVLGVAHAGRRGLLDGVIEQEVADMVARDARQVRAWIGPSICGACYEVPEQMRTESAQQIPALFSQTSWETPALDLPAGARQILAGLEAVVEVSDALAACTFETEGLFSHRGHTQRGEAPGRIAGLVWIDNKKD